MKDMPVDQNLVTLTELCHAEIKDRHPQGFAEKSLFAREITQILSYLEVSDYRGPQVIKCLVDLGLAHTDDKHDYHF